jgi:hypothetical protein
MVERLQRPGEKSRRPDLVSEEPDLTDYTGNLLINASASWVSILTRDSAERLLMTGRDSRLLPLRVLWKLFLQPLLIEYLVQQKEEKNILLDNTSQKKADADRNR